MLRMITTKVKSTRSRRDRKKGKGHGEAAFVVRLRRYSLRFARQARFWKLPLRIESRFLPFFLHLREHHTLDRLRKRKKRAALKE